MRGGNRDTKQNHFDSAAGLERRQASKNTLIRSNALVLVPRPCRRVLEPLKGNIQTKTSLKILNKIEENGINTQSELLPWGFHRHLYDFHSMERCIYCNICLDLLWFYLFLWLPFFKKKWKWRKHQALIMGPEQTSGKWYRQTAVEQGLLLN